MSGVTGSVRDMCGRYATSRSSDDLAAEFEVDEIFEGLPGADYNVAPTVEVPAVFERVNKETGQASRRLAPLVWGLVPSWAKVANGGAKLINARVESVAEKPSFRRAFSTRRCLLPADGFYEWYLPEAAREAVGRPIKTLGQAKKQPFFIHRSDGGVLAMAGIYEIWRDPAKERDDDSAWLRTCSVITTQATDAVGQIHDRMPMVIGADAYAAWLDPAQTDSAAALELLSVTDPAELEAYPVSTDVNKVQNNDPSLVEPLGDDEEQDRLI
jgi:putative SOS response-associated peptidase YedK